MGLSSVFSTWVGSSSEQSTALVSRNQIDSVIVRFITWSAMLLMLAPSFAQLSEGRLVGDRVCQRASPVKSVRTKCKDFDVPARRCFHDITVQNINFRILQVIDVYRVFCTHDGAMEKQLVGNWTVTSLKGTLTMHNNNMAFKSHYKQDRTRSAVAS